ncbi:MAG: tetratricopeptide repeat protein [Bacteroidia bacterium]
MRRLGLSICLLLVWGLGRSAGPQLSSQDSARIDTLLAHAWQNLYSQPETFLQLTDSSLRYSRTLRFDWGLARSFYYLGVGGYVQGNYDTALVHCDSALAAYQRSESDKLPYSLGNVQNIKGLTFNALGDYPAALNAFQAALRYNQEAKDLSSEANAYHNMAMVYEKMSEYDNALTYFQKGRAIRLTLDNKGVLAESDLGVGVAFLNLYQDDSAKVYLQKARQTFTDQQNTYGLSRTLNSLGILAMDAGQDAEAFQLFDQTYTYQSTNGDQDGMLSSLINMGELGLRQKRFSPAEERLIKAYELADTLNSKSRMVEAGKLLTKVYEAKGDLTKALLYQRRITLIADTLFQENRTQALAEMETQYKTEQQAQQISFQEGQIAQEQREKQIISWSAIGGALLLIALFVMLYLRYRLRKQIEMEQVLTQERKARFVAMLAAEEKERKRIATELHDGLGQLLSSARINVASLDDVIEEGDQEDQKVFQNSLDLIDNACDEIRQISHNLMPSALSRMGLNSALMDMRDKLNSAKETKLILEIEQMDQRLPEAVEFNVYRIVQEVVNNMLKHADATEIKLSWENKRSPMRLTIADNGKGMDLSLIESSEGLGWQNLHSRVDLLDGTLDIQSSPGQGLRLQIEIASVNA